MIVKGEAGRNPTTVVPRWVEEDPKKQGGYNEKRCGERQKAVVDNKQKSEDKPIAVSCSTK
jgi:hypothetical protein